MIVRELSHTPRKSIGSVIIEVRLMVSRTPTDYNFNYFVAQA